MNDKYLLRSGIIFAVIAIGVLGLYIKDRMAIRRDFEGITIKNNHFILTEKRSNSSMILPIIVGNSHREEDSTIAELATQAVKSVTIQTNQ